MSTTIKLISPKMYGGQLQPTDATLTLPDAVADAFVTDGAAIYVSRPHQPGEGLEPVYAFKDVTGGNTISAGTSQLKLPANATVVIDSAGALSVATQPVITTPPTLNPVSAGQPVTFVAAVATGTPAPGLSYLLYKNGALITDNYTSGAYSTVTASDVLLLRAKALNAAGAVYADSAPVTVSAAPTLVWRAVATGTFLQRNTMASIGVSTPTQMMSVSKHYLRSAVSAVKLVLANSSFGLSAGEQASTLTATATAAVQNAAGARTQVLFGGSASGALGSLLTSDAVAFSGASGDVIYPRIYRSGFAAGAVTFTNGQPTGASANYGTAIADATMTGDPGNAGSAGYMPCAIIAQVSPSTKAALLLGDSRTMGTGDSYSANSTAVGQLARSLEPDIAYINAAYGSDLASWFVSGNHDARVALKQYVTHVVWAMGINDLGASRTAAQLIADTQAARALYAGLPFYVCTLYPATDASNVPSSFETQRVAYNNAVRAGIPGVTGYFDIASALESSLNSGTYGNAAWVGDGLHTTQAGCIQIVNSGILRASMLA